MLLAIGATVVGLAVLAWSAERFVEGSAAVARFLGMSPLLIGMVVIGFGTSAPEMVVSVLAAAGGTPEIALGNALGSNVSNIGLILGVTALIAPIVVKGTIIRREIPILGAATVLIAAVLLDGTLSRVDAVILLVGLVAVFAWSLWQSSRDDDPDLAHAVETDAAAHVMTKRAAWTWLGVGLVALVGSSWVLVWGAVGIAERLGWSELVIGLTVVAIGTSAPELASSLIAARKGANELALGNVIGSNLFNTLGVIGLAGVVRPISDVSPEVLTRDLPILGGFTVVLLLVALGRGQGRINRWEGALLALGFVAYTLYLLLTA